MPIDFKPDKSPINIRGVLVIKSLPSFKNSVMVNPLPPPKLPKLPVSELTAIVQEVFSVSISPKSIIPSGNSVELVGKGEGLKDKTPSLSL